MSNKKTSTKVRNGSEELQTENNTPKQLNPTAEAFSGTYQTSTALNVREQPSMESKIIGILNTGTLVSCDGQYAMDNDTCYLYVSAQLDDDVTVEGYCQVQFLIKQ